MDELGEREEQGWAMNERLDAYKAGDPQSQKGHRRAEAEADSEALEEGERVYSSSPARLPAKNFRQVDSLSSSPSTGEAKNKMTNQQDAPKERGSLQKDSRKRSTRGSQRARSVTQEERGDCLEAEEEGVDIIKSERRGGTKKLVESD